MTVQSLTVPEQRGLDARFVVDRGDFTLDLELSVPPSTVTAIVGPNGAGKSTTLRILAGLLRPTVGTIELGGRVLDDAASGHHVVPARRGIGVVFQNYLLFPHLSAVDNVAFGLEARGVSRKTALNRAAAWLDRLGVDGFASVRPSALSGGQAQRVALARALVLEPPLLLLDEPLAALDASSRLDVRADLAGELRAFRGSTVLVTHDPIDAVALADEVIVLDRGRIAQRGTPREIVRQPANEYVAQLVGLNLLPSSTGQPLVFSPADVRLSSGSSSDAASAPGWKCRIDGLEEIGGRVRVRLTRQSDGARLAADISPDAFASLRVHTGDEVSASTPLTGT